MERILSSAMVTVAATALLAASACTTTETKVVPQPCGGTGGTGATGGTGGAGGQGGQGGSLPAPPQQPALTLWLAAEDLDTLGDGDTVTTWPDRSGAGYDVSGQAPGAPVFQSTALNGGAGVVFDGTDDYLAGAGDFGLVGDAAFTALTVLNLSSSNKQAYYPLVWLWGDPNAAGGTSSLEVKNDSLVWATGWMWDADTPSQAYNSYFDQPTIVSMTHSPGTISGGTRIHFDGAEQTVTGSTDTADLQAGVFGLGSWSHSQAADMILSELLVYDTALDDAARVQAECYLSQKWGVALDASVTCN